MTGKEAIPLAITSSFAAPEGAPAATVKYADPSACGATDMLEKCELRAYTTWPLET